VQVALISGYLKDVEMNLKDPDAHFSQGEIYDSYEKGTDAILHERLADKYYSTDKNIKGIAELRRILRNYYEKYDFKPEDFQLDLKVFLTHNEI
jgi:hypothetical protein